jgi:hypothetical protein
LARVYVPPPNPGKGFTGRRWRIFSHFRTRDLNRWEGAFAEILDDEETILWWHRNPDRKSYSVGIPIAGYSPKQNNFYPDFVVRVKGRTKGEDGIFSSLSKTCMSMSPNMGFASS